ncbi:MAG TPA: RNA polymerase subunit sigma, partial [Rugosimonospora sp.]|nr:RNA polymerase subunit sigma [Rugosimonospora sp.]
MSPTPLPDEYTLRAARRGSRPAREAVLAGYLPLIYNLVARALPDPAWVDDAVVEVLGALVTDLDEPRDAAARQSW